MMEGIGMKMKNYKKNEPSHASKIRWDYDDGLICRLNTSRLRAYKKKAYPQ
jgi:hypothetical protein